MLVVGHGLCFMNRDIQALIIDLTKYTPSRPVSPEDVHTYHSYQGARLHALISQEQAESAERLAKQVVELVGIAAEQKRLAAKLDSMTQQLLRLTGWLKWLTIALVFLTCVLCLLELRRRENVSQIGFNAPQVAPYIQPTNQPAQQDAPEHAKP
jgi:GAF domain-containing protein